MRLGVAAASLDGAAGYPRRRQKMEKPEDQTTKKNRESSIRWQGRTIEQFGYALNLILAIAIAGIGYEISLILNKEIECESWQNCLLFISLLAFVLSTSVALWCVVTRLRNFRVTAETARQREDGASVLELQLLRTKTKRLGEFTWTLFWWQISSFAIGVLLLVVVVAGSLVTVLSK
jgi:hypothetical protein